MFCVTEWATGDFICDLRAFSYKPTWDFVFRPGVAIGNFLYIDTVYDYDRGDKVLQLDMTQNSALEIFNATRTRMPAPLCKLGNSLYFVAARTPYSSQDPVTNDLWKSDGSVSGTVKVMALANSWDSDATYSGADTKSIADYGIVSNSLRGTGWPANLFLMFSIALQAALCLLKQSHLSPGPAR